MARPDEIGPFDVVIAGAGLAGASLALSLAKAGVHVAILDPGRFPRDKLCGEFLSPEAWLVLDRLGLVEAVARSDYHPIRRVRISTPRGTLLEASILGTDGQPGIGLGRFAFDAMLLQHAEDAGATALQGTQVGPPLIEHGRVVGVDARDQLRGPIRVRAAVTIAADGRHSSLVQRTGRLRRRTSHGTSHFGLKRHLRVGDSAAADPPETVGLHSVAGGYVGTCRVDQGLTNLCGLLPTASLKPHRGSLDGLADATFRRNPCLARLWDASTPAGPWKTVANVEIVAATPRLPGILYAGDARGTVDPLGGQGMTMALLGAEVLAPFVLKALRPGAHFEPLARDYQGAWDQRFSRRIRLCRAFHHVLTRPRLLDLASALGPLAPSILAACYHATRDPKVIGSASPLRRPVPSSSAGSKPCCRS